MVEVAKMHRSALATCQSGICIVHVHVEGKIHRWYLTCLHRADESSCQQYVHRVGRVRHPESDLGQTANDKATKPKVGCRLLQLQLQTDQAQRFSAPVSYELVRGFRGLDGSESHRKQHFSDFIKIAQKLVLKRFFCHFWSVSLSNNTTIYDGPLYKQIVNIGVYHHLLSLLYSHLSLIFYHS